MPRRHLQVTFSYFLCFYMKIILLVLLLPTNKTAVSCELYKTKPGFGFDGSS